jgi:rod shape-determining protein MreC
MAVGKTGLQFRISAIVLGFLVIISGVFLAFSTGAIVLDVKSAGFSAVSLLQKGVYTVTSTVTSTLTAVRDIADIREEHEALLRQMENFEILQRTNADIRQENERLKEQLGFSEDYAYSNIPAFIISRDPDSLYSSLIINKGSAAGVKKNMPVIATQKGMVGLVGKVITVGYQTSSVMPIYDSQCNVSARIRTTRDIGIVSGRGTPEMPLAMRYIKKSVSNELQRGDIVVTSGENGNYLRDIPLGTISKISTLDYDSSLNIELIPVIDFSKLETVIVVDLKSPLQDIFQ